MPVKRKRYVKNMENVWIKCDKNMTPLMALMYGRLHMAFMTGGLRMASYTWTSTYGRLHVVLMSAC